MINRTWILKATCLTVCLLLGVAAPAQTSADSMAVVRAHWKSAQIEKGIVLKKAQLKVFNSDQQICLMEIDPAQYRLAVVQDAERKTTSDLGEQHHAVAALNGGFFRTDTPDAVTLGYVRTGGDSAAANASGMRGAVAIDQQGRLSLVAQDPRTNRSGKDWSALSCSEYPDVLTAGPMFVVAGATRRTWGEGVVRNPRSVVALKKDGTVVLLTVDGRQKGADGLDYNEMACLMRWLGVQAALNLDGGGSTTLWSSRHGVLNSPCNFSFFFGVSQRKVANALVVQPR